jgi:hypothetical protein
MREVVRVSALGPTSWTDLPTLAELSAPWCLIPQESGPDAVRVAKRGATVEQHLWERVTTRSYFWDEPGDPRANDTVRKLVLTVVPDASRFAP